jgi:hypothetical protein
MLRKRKEQKAKKSVAEALLRDIQGTAAEKLVLFEKLAKDLLAKIAPRFSGLSGCCRGLRHRRSDDLPTGRTGWRVGMGGNRQVKVVIFTLAGLAQEMLSPNWRWRSTPLRPSAVPRGS